MKTLSPAPVNSPRSRRFAHSRSQARAWRFLAVILVASVGSVIAATVRVDVGGTSPVFEPASITIQPGDTVQWVWGQTGFFHSVTSGTNGTADGLFNSGIHKDPFTFSFTFPNAGTFNYYCQPHVSMGMKGVVTVAAATPTPSPSGVAAQISTRLSVGTGDSTLIVGFIVDGDVPKKMLIRGIGTSLQPFFGAKALADPILTLRNQATGEFLGMNDNWKTTQIGGVITGDQAAEIQASGSAPSQDAESAILASLPKGQYTAEVKGANGGTGFALAEIYDRETTSTATLANLSTRGLVETDDNIMISGLFVVNSSARIVVRALGPTLGDFGVPNAMADPTLDIVNADGTTAASNDNWGDAANAGDIPVNLKPSHSTEAAILTTLAPARYTLQLRGSNRSTGAALLEAYVLK